MSLIACSECGKRVSDKAPACPDCGHLIAGSGAVTPRKEKKIDKRGAWCPNCGNRNSYKQTKGVGCIVLCILFVTVVGLLFIPFLPKEWTCKECKHSWKA